MVINGTKSVRRRLSPDARREEIVVAAERVLRRGGAAARVDDIMTEAKAAKGTFYLYFPTFDDLLAEVRERQATKLEAAVAPLLAHRPEKTDWAGLLPSLAHAFVDFVLGLEGLHEALFHSSFTQARPLPPARRPAARIAAIIRAGQAAGAYDDVDPEPTAALLFAAMHEAADDIAAGADRERTLAALDRLLAAAVGTKSERAY